MTQKIPISKLNSFIVAKCNKSMSNILFYDLTNVDEAQLGLSTNIIWPESGSKFGILFGTIALLTKICSILCHLLSSVPHNYYSSWRALSLELQHMLFWSTCWKAWLNMKLKHFGDKKKKKKTYATIFPGVDLAGNSPQGPDRAMFRGNCKKSYRHVSDQTLQASISMKNGLHGAIR